MASLASRLQRFAILGDIHAEDRALRQALAFAQQWAVEAILAVGDIVDGTGDPGACCRLLSSAGALVVRGNHDRWLLTDTLRHLPSATRRIDLGPTETVFLSSLPAVRRIATARGALLLCHGTGEDDMHAVQPDDSGYALETNTDLQGILRDPDTTILIGGHSHRRMVRRIASLTLVNAGALADSESPCFGIVDLGRAPSVTFFTWAAGTIVPAEIVPLPL